LPHDTSTAHSCASAWLVATASDSRQARAASRTELLLRGGTAVTVEANGYHT